MVSVVPRTLTETFAGASSSFGWDLNWEDNGSATPNLLNAGGVGGIKAGGSYFFESRKTGAGSTVYPWADHPELWVDAATSPYAYYVELTVAAWPTIGPAEAIGECDLWLGSDAGNVMYFDNGGGSTRTEYPLTTGSTPTAVPIGAGSVVRLELRDDGSVDYSIDGITIRSSGAGHVVPDYSSGWPGGYHSNCYVGFQISPGSGPDWGDCEVAIDNVTLGPL